MLYKVEQEFIYGWDHAPWSDNLFDSHDEAQDAIDQYIADIKVAVAAGDMSDDYDPDEYRVAPIRTPIDAFSSEEVVELLEGVLIALQDAEIFDCIVNSTDIDDEHMIDVRERLFRVMNNKD